MDRTSEPGTSSTFGLGSPFSSRFSARASLSRLVLSFLLLGFSSFSLLLLFLPSPHLSLITLVFCIVQTHLKRRFCQYSSLLFHCLSLQLFPSKEGHAASFAALSTPGLSFQHHITRPIGPSHPLDRLEKAPTLPYKRTGRPPITTSSLSTSTTHDTHERSNAGTLELHGRLGNSLPFHFFSFQVDPRPSLRVLALPCH